MKFKKLALAAACSAVFITACGGSDSKSKNSSSGDNDGSNTSKPVVAISGDILADKVLTEDTIWVIQGIVNVGDGSGLISSQSDIDDAKNATLTIEPGTEIVADGDGTLIINRGSKLMAEGTRAKPITFSSQADDDYDGLGEWGGIIVQGFAPHNAPGSNALCSSAGFCNVQGEGGDSTVKYFGGTEEADDSGIIKYVRIAEAGKVAGANNEINGLTLQGVGYGTTVEYVQVHNNLDDGVEWFGGTVNAKYLVLTGNDDDDIDFDEGFIGNIQYAIIQKSPTATAPQGSNDPRGIEANSSDADSVIATNAVLSNITIIGSDITSGANDQPAMRLRGDLTTEIHNTAITDYNGSCIRVDNGQADATDVTFNNILVGGCGTDGNYTKFKANGIAGDGFDALPNPSGQATIEQLSNNASLVLNDRYAVTNNEASLGFDVIPTAVGNSGFVFETTNYIGAVDPTATGDAWWEGWTLPNTLREDKVPVATEIEVLDADILADKTLTNDKVWVLQGVINVGSGSGFITTQADIDNASNVTLTIEPGTNIVADGDGTLIVNRGSKIEAAGTAINPITFSSQADDDYDGLGEWGGIIIQGFAPHNAPGSNALCSTAGFCNVQGEGGDDTVKYFGGTAADDDSGTFKYVRIAEAGKVAGANNEINGLTLQGVGHGTTVEYVQVHNNLDDGVEWFGGTVNAKYLVLTGNDDDDIDFDEGFKGNIQYALVIKNQSATAPQGSNDPRGIEANSSDDESVLATEAVLANVTIIGSDITSGANDQPAMRLRGDLTVSIHNTVVTAYNGSCLRVDNGQADATDVTFNNILVGDCGTDGNYTKFKANGITGDGFDAVPTATGLATVSQKAANAGLALNSQFAVTDAAAQLAAAATITAVDNGSNFAFDQTDYMGAVDPDAATGWWEGWTLPGTVNVAP